MSTHFPNIGEQPAIVISGADARRYAQSQFCGAVDELAANRWQWNAWLTPVGKVRALMHLVDAGDGTLLMVPRGGDVRGLMATLQRYVMRAQVALSVRGFAAQAGPSLPMGVVADSGDALTLGMGERSLRLTPHSGSPQIDAAAAAAWRLADIRAGWPTLPDAEPEFLPPALALEQLGAIAYDKGCYPGQEIAARLHFRGGHKHRLCHLRGTAPLALGATRSSDGTEVVVTDSVCEDGVCEALVVITGTINLEINILDCIYRLISSFVA